MMKLPVIPSNIHGNKLVPIPGYYNCGIYTTISCHYSYSFVNYFFFLLTQANPFEHLDLIEYTCQELMVSFAVSNRAGISNFSTAISMIINKGNNYWK